MGGRPAWKPLLSHPLGSAVPEALSSATLTARLVLFKVQVPQPGVVVAPAWFKGRLDAQLPPRHGVIKGTVKPCVRLTLYQGAVEALSHLMAWEVVFIFSFALQTEALQLLKAKKFPTYCVMVKSYSDSREFGLELWLYTSLAERPWAGDLTCVQICVKGMAIFMLYPYWEDPTTHTHTHPTPDKSGVHSHLLPTEQWLVFARCDPVSSWKG